MKMTPGMDLGYDARKNPLLSIYSAWSVGSTKYKYDDHPPTEPTGNANSNNNNSKRPSLTSSALLRMKKGASIDFADNMIQGTVGSQVIESYGSSPINTPPPNVTTIEFIPSAYENRLLHQPSQSIDAVLSTACECMGFEIAEVWLRTGPRTHQLINSHIRPTALDDETAKKELVDVYYGDLASERTHRLSPMLCKKAKAAKDVVWITAGTTYGDQALSYSISNVRTAVAVPVCHEASNTNITIIYFSVRPTNFQATSNEFLVHMSLAAAVASVNTMAEPTEPKSSSNKQQLQQQQQQHNQNLSQSVTIHLNKHSHTNNMNTSRGTRPIPHTPASAIDALHQRQQEKSTPAHLMMATLSVTGANLNLQWTDLENIEYLTDGGNNWIHTAVLNREPVVIKTLKPECQDVASAINEIEGELTIHSKLDHAHIVSLFGAGYQSTTGIRFLVLERLDGGTLSQVLGYETRIRDRRKRFWKRKKMSYPEVLKLVTCLADAMNYCHSKAIPGHMILHRDLKPDNIGFRLDGTLKVIDFGLSRIVENASPTSDDVYEMTGETGSLRYMAPEVASAKPYNHKADVYSFGIIMWEVVAYEKPFSGMDRQQFYERVVYNAERPPIGKNFRDDYAKLMTQCWSHESEDRPNFAKIVESLNNIIANEAGNRKGSILKIKKKSSLSDRSSAWF